MRLKRFLLPVALGLAGYFALFGGEYTAPEVARIREARDQEAAELARLRHEVDSLRALVDSLETDPAMLERLARERFGMIRDGEILYRFAEPEDSTESEEDDGG